MDEIRIHIPKGMVEYARAFLGRSPRWPRDAVREAIATMSVEGARPDLTAATRVRWNPPPPLHGLEQLAAVSAPGRLDLTAQRDDPDGASTSFTVGLGMRRAGWPRVTLVSMVGPQAYLHRDSFDPMSFRAEHDLEQRRESVRWLFRRNGKACGVKAFRALRPAGPWRGVLIGFDSGDIAQRAPADGFESPRHVFDALVGGLPTGSATPTAERPASRLF